jgi:hypothetical protein
VLLLWLILDRWHWMSPLALAGVAVVASFASSTRIHAGLPIFLGALVVLMLRCKAWFHLFAGAALLVVAYLSVYRSVWTR